MKSLLRRLPRSKSKSRRAENSTIITTTSTEAQNTKQDDLRVPKIEPADLKVGADGDRQTCNYLLSGAEKLRGVPSEPRQQDGGEGVEPDQGDRQGESHPVRAAESLSGLPPSHPPPHGSQ